MNEGIDAAVERDDGVGETACLSLVGEIGRERSEVRVREGGIGDATRRTGDHGARVEEGFGNGSAKAAGGAGDEDDGEACACGHTESATATLYSRTAGGKKIAALADSV